MQKRFNHIIKFIAKDGAVFYFSAASFRDWKCSLAFYRGIGWRAKIKKMVCLLAYPVAKLVASLSSSVVRQEISGILGVDIPEISNTVISAMVSMTHKKAVVHYHGRGYHKIAVGNCADDVAGEVNVYRQLSENNLNYIIHSPVELLKHDAECVQFFMYYAAGKYCEKNIDVLELTAALEEFFNVTAGNKKSWSDLWKSLNVPELTEKLPAEHFDGETPVGMVHRDFKPWNIKIGKKILFYDFESAVCDGCPLEDYFNYIADPLLRRYHPEKVLNIINKKYWKSAEVFLRSWDINVREVKRYWHWYLLERIVFWRKNDQSEFAEKFIVLLEKTL